MNRFQKSTSDSLDPAIVEQIVREVVARLSAGPGRSSVEVINGNAAHDRPLEKKSPIATGHCRIDDRVITLEQLRGRLEGTRTVVVRPGAIVTPAVRDELKSRKIQLEVGAAEATAPTSPKATAQGFCLARLSDHFVPLEWLKEVGVEQVCCGNDYAALAAQLGREQAAGLSVCLAAQPYVAVATLNKNEQLRAAFGRTIKDIREIRSTLKANVLVLDAIQPRQELLPLIREFTGESGGGKTLS